MTDKQQQYLEGWKTGANWLELPKNHTMEFHRGWTDGWLARQSAIDKASELYQNRIDVLAILQQAQRKVQPIIDHERKGEHISQGLMEFRMR
jgi:hypothetical protein